MEKKGAAGYGHREGSAINKRRRNTAKHTTIRKICNQLEVLTHGEGNPRAPVIAYGSC